MLRTVVDQLGRRLEVSDSVKRIISLVPSQTELLFDLGLDREVVGVTRFCVHPKDKVRKRTIIGGTKKLNVELIRSLKPDLIIGNKEENEQEQINQLMQEFPVWMSDIYSIEHAKDAILQIGKLVDREPEAAYINHLLHAGFTDLKTLALQKGIKKKVAYAIWKSPFMWAGKHTFIDDVLQYAGLDNVVLQPRYPLMELKDVSLLKPELILLSSEPYPFNQSHLSDFHQLFPDSTVMLVDGEMFSWYGSRMLKAIQYLFELQDRLLR